MHIVMIITENCDSRRWREYFLVFLNENCTFIAPIEIAPSFCSSSFSNKQEEACDIVKYI